MKPNKILVLIAFLSLSQMNAQEKKEQGPLSEPRYNFFKQTILFFNEYLNTDSGSYNTTDIRYLKPLGKNQYNLRVNLPIVSTNNATSLNQTGLGDIDISIAYLPFSDGNDGLVIRGKLTVPTASAAAFGSGKWVFTPTVFWGHYWDSQKKWFSISSLEQQNSFAGQSNRNHINTTVFENTLQYSFGKNWIGINAAIRYNYVADGFNNSSYIELGRKINPNFLVYVHPSVAYGGVRSYKTGFEFGILYLY